MDLQDLFYTLRINQEYYIKDNVAIDFSEIGCTVSTNNLKRMIDHHFEITNQPRPENVSKIEIHGMRVFPSDFLSDDEIIVGKISKMQTL